MKAPVKARVSTKAKTTIKRATTKKVASATKTRRPEKRTMGRNQNAARGPERVLEETNKKISPKARVPATVNVKGRSKAVKSAESRVLKTQKRVRTAIKTKGGVLEKPKATRPLKVTAPSGKSRIKKKKATTINKLGPTTMEMVSLTQGRSSFKGLKKTKAVKPSLKPRRVNGKRARVAK